MVSQKVKLLYLKTHHGLKCLLKFFPMRHNILLNGMLLLLATKLCFCSKPDEDDHIPSHWSTPQPPRVWQVNFIFADDNGFNLLPHPLPPNPVVNPNDFYAYYLKDGKPVIRNQNFGYTRNTRSGHVFRIAELRDSLKVSDSFLRDSTVVFYACFANNCDTITIIDPLFSCEHTAVRWNGYLLGFYWNQYENVGLILNADSATSYSCHGVPLRPSFSNLFNP